MNVAEPGGLLSPRDALFHQPAYRDPTWMETNWFSFMVPEHNLRGHVYIGFRTNIGAVFSFVYVWTHDAPTMIHMDYSDARFHLPMPAGNLDHYQLANGVEVTMLEPLQRYAVTYRGRYDTNFDLECVGIMPAIDSREVILPGGSDFSHFHKVDPRLATGIGHIDQTMAVKGQITVRGKPYEVNYPSSRDHSWSPRPEEAHGMGYFDQGYWGEEFGFHVQTKQDVLNSGRVTNGYILERGKVVPLKAGDGRYEVDGWMTKRIHYELEDVQGRTYRFTGIPTATSIVQSFPNTYCHAGLTRWDYEGEDGWGEYAWHWEVGEMQERVRMMWEAENSAKSREELIT